VFGDVFDVGVAEAGVQREEDDVLLGVDGVDEAELGNECEREAGGVVHGATGV